MRPVHFVLALEVLMATSAARGAEPTCDHLQVALAAGLTPEIVARDWASGDPHTEPNAVLELRGCAGELLDRLELAAPLAKLDPVPLHGVSVPTWLVSADLTAPAGTTSGPLTLPVEVVEHHLRPARTHDARGDEQPIQLAATGKAAWKRLRTKHGDELLAVSCAPANGGFVTSYRHYRPGPRGWTLRTRLKSGLWESDADFPAVAAFP